MLPSLPFAWLKMQAPLTILLSAAFPVPQLRHLLGLHSVKLLGQRCMHTIKSLICILCLSPRSDILRSSKTTEVIHQFFFLKKPQDSFAGVASAVKLASFLEEMDTKKELNLNLITKFIVN